MESRSADIVHIWVHTLASYMRVAELLMVLGTSIAETTLKLRRRPDEEHVPYMKQSADRIKRLFADSECRPIHVQLLARYWDAAFEEE